MMTVIAGLLLVWLVLAVLGVMFEGLIWLTVVAGVLFVATAAYGAIKRRSARRIS